MELFDTVLMIFLKILFFAGLPCLIIYFRYKQKITTGFAVGMVLTSFLLGLISISSFQPDLHKQLASELNEKQIDKAEHTLRLIVQSGSEEVKKIDEKNFIFPEIYRKLKVKLAADYLGIAERYKYEYQLKADTRCSTLSDQKSALSKLRHAVKLTGFAESIGGSNKSLKESLQKSVTEGDKIIQNLEVKCSAEDKE